MSKFHKQPPVLPLAKNLVLKEEFLYTKGNMTLSFTLKLNPTDVKDFQECMNEAIKDIAMVSKTITKK